MISIMRIDDRLVHGQIITMWLKESSASQILVIDDLVAGDDMMKMIMGMAIPAGVKLTIGSVNDALSLLESFKDINVLLLVRNPLVALQLLELGIDIKEINLGNISNTRSDSPRKKMQHNLYITKEDADSLIKITEKGIKIESRAVPPEKSVDIIAQIEKDF